MNRLEGVGIPLFSIRDVKPFIGRSVIYLRHCDIDKSGRGYFFPQYGTIERCHGRNVQINDQWYGLSQLSEMVLREK